MANNIPTFPVSYDERKNRLSRYRLYRFFPAPVAHTDNEEEPQSYPKVAFSYPNNKLTELRARVLWLERKLNEHIDRAKSKKRISKY